MGKKKERAKRVGVGVEQRQSSIRFRLVTVPYICIKPEGTIETERTAEESELLQLHREKEKEKEKEKEMGEKSGRCLAFNGADTITEV